MDTAKSLSFSILCDESHKCGDAEKLLPILVQVYLKNSMVNSSPVTLRLLVLSICQQMGYSQLSMILSSGMASHFNIWLVLHQIHAM